ncbi:acyl-CoA dehydrogenase family protein [Parahaliea aestuarii]|uniref:Acyl-CoA dehydrogenase n=1 Tax=Parahaliea aestuarii TaxID=1852021 RepID=A0A5C8ZUN4_9GAMM|nr:acyl-CoA dehydrogenase family protein [Parahaliea aestuarii]TXS91177.1 acyl-CoA dehydrogenase [Parahaliea aestuarii]
MTDSVFLDSIQPLFQDIHAHFTSQPDLNPQAAWDELVQSGFLRLLLPESAEGAGLSVAEALPVLMAAGYWALPLPYVETALLYAALPDALADAIDGNLALAVGTCGPGEPAQPLRLGLHCLDALVTAKDGGITVAPVSGDVEQGWRLQGEVTPLSQVLDIRLLGTAAECLQLAGAMQRVLELTVDYANTRQQFGRPIGKYQALQQQISVMTGHCHSAVMAAQLAAGGMQRSNTGLSLDHHRVAAACGMIKAACQPVVSTAHAVHGAIGVTEEYELHHYTRRLLAGRLAGGSESRWFEQVGQACLDSGASVFDFTLANLS